MRMYIYIYRCGKYLCDDPMDAEYVYVDVCI
jgi:hypothetical protein